MGIIFQVFISSNLLEHLEAINLRQFQVEQHYCGITVGARLVIAPAIQVIERLFAVARDHYFINEVYSARPVRVSSTSFGSSSTNNMRFRPFMF